MTLCGGCSTGGITLGYAQCMCRYHKKCEYHVKCPTCTKLVGIVINPDFTKCAICNKLPKNISGTTSKLHFLCNTCILYQYKCVTRSIGSNIINIDTVMFDKSKIPQSIHVLNSVRSIVFNKLEKSWRWVVDGEYIHDLFWEMCNLICKTSKTIHIDKLFKEYYKGPDTQYKASLTEFKTFIYNNQNYSKFKVHLMNSMKRARAKTELCIYDITTLERRIATSGLRGITILKLLKEYDNVLDDLNILKERKTVIQPDGLNVVFHASVFPVTHIPKQQKMNRTKLKAVIRQMHNPRNSRKHKTCE